MALKNIVIDPNYLFIDQKHIHQNIFNFLKDLFADYNLYTDRIHPEEFHNTLADLTNLKDRIYGKSYYHIFDSFYEILYFGYIIEKSDSDVATFLRVARKLFTDFLMNNIMHMTKSVYNMKDDNIVVQNLSNASPINIYEDLGTDLINLLTNPEYKIFFIFSGAESNFLFDERKVDAVLDQSMIAIEDYNSIPHFLNKNLVEQHTLLEKSFGIDINESIYVGHEYNFLETYMDRLVS